MKQQTTRNVQLKSISPLSANSKKADPNTIKITQVAKKPTQPKVSNKKDQTNQESKKAENRKVESTADEAAANKKTKDKQKIAVGQEKTHVLEKAKTTKTGEKDKKSISPDRRFREDDPL